MNLKNTKWFDIAINVLSVIYVAMLFHYSIVMWDTKKKYGIVFLGLSLIISILIAGKKQNIFPKVKGYLSHFFMIVLLGAAVSGSLYFFMNFDELVYVRVGDNTFTDLVFAFIMIYLVFHLLIIRTGIVIPLVAAVFILYGLFGHLFPAGSFFSHAPMNVERILEVCASQVDGIFGMLNEIGATYVAIFSFFAALVQGFGGLDYVIRLAYQIVGKYKSNIPQVAVISSMAFGGMSGSAIANVVGTGSFTIPTMKKFGVPGKIAAAIESIASSGGQIMPPILGAVAFVMADYLNRFYFQIMLNSIYPALAFYGVVFLSVYFISKKYIPDDIEITDDPMMQIKMTRKEKLAGLPILIAFVALVVVFIVWQVDIMIGGFITVMVFLFCRLVYDLLSGGVRAATLKQYVVNLYKGMIIGAETMLSIALMLSILGIVVNVLTTTGMAEKLSFYMVQNFGHNLYLFFFFTCVICIIFGMAVSTVAAYILAVTLAAPAMLQLGVDPLITHFSVFYWSMLSGITPPVAAVCVAGAGIAGAKFLPTCWESCKIGFTIFFLPIIFLTDPRILDFGLNGLEPLVVCLVAFGALAAFFQSDFKIGHRLALLGLFIFTFFSKYSDWGIFTGQTLKRILVVVTLVYMIYLIRDSAKKRKAQVEARTAAKTAAKA